MFSNRGDLIGLGAKGGIGKDTMGDYLVQKYGYIKKSFADNLKQCCHSLFRIDIESMYDQEKKAAQFRVPIIYGIYAHQAVLEWMIENLSGFTPKSSCIPDAAVNKHLWSVREVLQFVGSDIMRSHVPDYHIRTCIDSMDRNRKYVICDARFPNEGDAVISAGGMCMRLDRKSIIQDEKLSSHISETAMDKWEKWSYIIDNNTDGLDFLYNKVDKIMEEIINGK
jgi:hypothetical protein